MRPPLCSICKPSIFPSMTKMCHFDVPRSYNSLSMTQCLHKEGTHNSNHGVSNMVFSSLFAGYLSNWILTACNMLVVLFLFFQALKHIQIEQNFKLTDIHKALFCYPNTDHTFIWDESLQKLACLNLKSKYITLTDRIWPPSM